jgi:hypothetical protein
VQRNPHWPLKAPGFFLGPEIPSLCFFLAAVKSPSASGSNFAARIASRRPRLYKLYKHRSQVGQLLTGSFVTDDLCAMSMMRTIQSYDGSLYPFPLVL